MAREDRDPDVPRHGEPLRRDRLLAWPKVRELYGISRTTAWRLQKVGEFPQPVHISSGRVGWRESELILWAASRAHRDAVQCDPPRPHDPSPTPTPGATRTDKPAEGPSHGPPRPRQPLNGQASFEF